jgi:hypothetical protein
MKAHAQQRSESSRATLILWRRIGACGSGDEPKGCPEFATALTYSPGHLGSTRN